MGDIAKHIRDMSRFGAKAVACGLTSSRFGNISVLQDDTILITKTGSMLDEIEVHCVVGIDRYKPCKDDQIASCEAPVHRAIYAGCQAKAVFHTHSPYAVSLSLIYRDLVEPVDSEGKAMLGHMPIVDGQFGSLELAARASESLRGHKACIARGHGVFAIGTTLEEAYTVACMAEHSSQVLFTVQLMERCGMVSPGGPRL